MGQSQEWNFDGIPPATPSDGTPLDFSGIPPATPERSAVDQAIGAAQIFPGVTMDMGKGFVREAGKRVNQAGKWLRKKVPALDVGPSIPFATESKNPQEKVGAGLENLAEFALGGEVAGTTAGAFRLGGMAAPLLEGALQGATAYGISKGQGTSETGARVTGGLSAVAPVATKALELYGPTLAANAKNALARVFSQGLENKSPIVDYAVKTGNIGNKSVGDAVKIVNQAASDTLDLPIAASWGKWQTQLTKAVGQKGQDLKAALAGPLGDQELPFKPIYDALDDLKKTKAQHFAQVSRGGFQDVTYDDARGQAVDQLVDWIKDKYKDYPTITLRNLVNLKQTWDDAVYTLSTSGKVGIAPDVLAATAQKEVKKRAADTIRAMFDQQAPSIDALNEAFSNQKRLEDLVAKIYKVRPGMGPGGSTLLHVMGAAGGAAAGESFGHPLYGILAGGGMARLVQSAVESPLWQTLTPVLKDKLATALANGNAEAARKILAPLIATGVSKATQQPISVSAPDGQTYHFPDQAKADAFTRASGLAP